MFLISVENPFCMGSRLILKFVDAGNDLRHKCEIVDYNKLSLYWVDNSLVRF